MYKEFKGRGCSDRHYNMLNAHWTDSYLAAWAEC